MRKLVRGAAPIPGARVTAEWKTDRMSFPCAPRRYCAKYPEISMIKCVALLANALIDPFVVGTIAMFDVIAQIGRAHV